MLPLSAPKTRSWKTHIASSVHICVFGTSAQTIRKGGAILAEWSSYELKPWWRNHRLNQIKPISLWRRSPWSNPRWQRIQYHFGQSGWLSICKSCWCFQWDCEEHQDQANFHLGGIKFQPLSKAPVPFPEAQKKKRDWEQSCKSPK